MKWVARLLRGSCTCNCGLFSNYGCLNNKHCHNKASGCNM